ncbi:MAG: 50S ribosomal protein L11 methyltransferase [Asticcacaulis sp.]|nr:50S ribosomal protein L11 methyltransferase [Asticcacaulis sp.]
MNDIKAFIRAHTRPLPVPSLPSIRLYQADEVTPLWLMTEQDMATQRLAPPFWAFAWSGGQALARYVLEHPEIVRGRRVLDIACGSGLVGIAARLVGAESVLCNDIDPYTEAAVGLNASLNGVELAFTGADLLAGPAPDVDLILAGDICYEKPMTDAMLTYFRRAALHKIEVYIGDPHRTYFPKTGLTRLADYDILTNADIEEAAVKPASVWKLEN